MVKQNEDVKLNRSRLIKSKKSNELSRSFFTVSKSAIADLYQDQSDLIGYQVRDTIQISFFVSLPYLHCGMGLAVEINQD